MAGEIEVNVCQTCGKKGPVQRRYFYYHIKCACCVGDRHFQYVMYCVDCKPRTPSKTVVHLEIEPDA